VSAGSGRFDGRVAVVTGAGAADGAANLDDEAAALQEAAQGELASLLAEALQLSAGIAH